MSSILAQFNIYDRSVILEDLRKHYSKRYMKKISLREALRIALEERHMELFDPSYKDYKPETTPL